jgi:transcriptional regulator with XRE-family HTH domain
MQYFAEKMIELRKSRGLSQKQVAENIGVTPGIVSAYELGKKYPSLEVLINICTFFNVSADYMLGLSDSFKLLKSDLTDSQMKIIRQLIRELESKNK